MTKVFIAATTPTMRAGLRALLMHTDMQVVDEGSALTNAALRLAYVDVFVLADAQLLADAAHDLSASEALALVVLSDEAQTVRLLQSLPLRGWGIVSSEASTEELEAAIKAVEQGLIVLPPALAEQQFTQRAVVDEPTEPLTTREQEVLNLISQGLSNKLIAQQLSISEHTVKFHISSLYTKLGASSRTDAVSRGARRGLITL
ncbi:MAG: response regulator transcription factor [Chloroflexi bacterium AL-W]|nr:response regulator transcription factor [Chloroflexi bacterium AL-N1]NOK71241.1 response regulator transcription factor [Chloroflexi bacterium AL-N10]NOK76530.1 response regulator transcription factor [Chloroflexi bacterium AL-N5]NOK83648.1 response regulator transcription factor [Chloroflexi bacterium AL-W]NOK92231.1 response regulator transcription factor [Chloroflexi bacterium AL-N15]